MDVILGPLHILSVICIGYIISTCHENIMICTSILLIPNLLLFFFIKSPKFKLIDEKIDYSDSFPLSIIYVVFILSSIYLFQFNIPLLLFSTAFTPFIYAKYNYYLLSIPFGTFHIINPVISADILIAMIHLSLFISFSYLFSKYHKFDPSLYQQITIQISIVQSVLLILYYILFKPTITHVQPFFFLLFCISFLPCNNLLLEHHIVF